MKPFPRIVRTASLLCCLLASDLLAATRYVDLNSSSPMQPYADWTTAATGIQDAINVADPNDEIVVSNGVYNTGGTVVYGFLTNRIAVTKPLAIRSVNGPLVTVIEGYQVPGTITGTSAVRCAYLTNGASLSGFTLTKGATRSGPDSDLMGGGAWCESTAAVLSNCVLIANSAASVGGGGGVYQGSLFNCTVISNSAISAGGVYHSILNNCRLTANTASSSGGAAVGSQLNNCILDSNSASDGGATVGGCVLNGCTLTNNLATLNFGGAANNCTLNDCWLSGNNAPKGGGGAASCTLNNCRLTDNTSSGLGGGAYLCTLTNCRLTSNMAVNGGGTFGGTTFNCFLFGNTATASGGGAATGTLRNSALVQNSARVSGGGSSSNTLFSCTVAGNSAILGGGTFASTATNCIVFFNRAENGVNHLGGSLNHCCTTPLPVNGSANITADPQLTDLFHLGANSPCVGAGNMAVVSGVDLDLESWAAMPSIGCDEYYAGSPTGALSVVIVSDFTNLATGFQASLLAQIFGHANRSVWDFGDGTYVTNQPLASHAWSSAGDYEVTIQAFNEDNPAGISSTIHIRVRDQPVQYVSLSSSNPAAPFTSWATAAANIQDALDVSFGGGKVLVSNGVYRTGGRVVYGSLTNRVSVTKPVMLQSLNGPDVTVIQGYQVTGTITGDSAIRCIYLTSGASLTGFTLTNGATRSTGDVDLDMAGGGIWCGSTNSVVSNCVVIANVAARRVGGVYYGTLLNSLIMSNRNLSASLGGGGGIYQSSAKECILIGNQCGDLGAGAANSTLLGCILSGNYASSAGGAAANSTLNNCQLTNNLSPNGGGAYSCTLSNCLLSQNAATQQGGAAYTSTLTDCIVAGNSATNWGGGTYNCTLYNSTISSNRAYQLGGGTYGGTALHCNYFGNVSQNANGGGAYNGLLTNCWLFANRAVRGGGTYNGTLDKCRLESNASSESGGGMVGATLYNCLLRGNTSADGGGALQGTLVNCTVVGNSATNTGGGVRLSTVRNSIIYFNTAPTASNQSASLSYVCTTPPAVGPGVITNAPVFVDQISANFRLQTNSPCINAGLNSHIVGGADHDGRPRIVGANVDLGAYEFQAAGMGEFVGWLDQYGLPTDGSADASDPDADGHANWQEWRAGTIPTNGASVLRLSSLTTAHPGLTVNWTSVSGKDYWVERATNVPAFFTVATNLIGLPGTMSYNDLTATNGGLFFYRVGVQ